MKFVNSWITASENYENIKTKHLHILSLIKISQAGIIYGGTSLSEINQASRVFEYYQTLSILLKTTKYIHYDYELFSKIIKLNTKCGYKQKALHTFFYALQYIYSHFEAFDHEVYAQYPSYLSFFEFSRSAPEQFYKANFFLRYIHNYMELLFILKKTKILKKKKKKNTKNSKIKIKVSFVAKHNRSAVTTRLISLYINQFALATKNHRVRTGLFYLLLSGKQSVLYLKKLSMYNTLLEKKKFY